MVAEGVFSMGPGTLQIDRRQFHEPLRQNVVNRMRDALCDKDVGIAVFQVRGCVCVHGKQP